MNLAKPRGRSPALGLLLLVLTLPGCAWLGIGGVNLISIEEEWEMGRQLEAELAGELDLLDDPAVNEYVTRVGEMLVAETEMADLEWRFHVVENSDVNAFNVPGGLVYVHTGMIREAGSAAEFVAVMGHELGHGVERHGTERLSQQYGLSVLASLVLGQDPGVLQEIVAQIAAAGAIAQFSQEQEFEADEVGTRLMAEGGFHPRGMVALLEHLLELREREPGTVEQLFATHPAVPERIDRAEQRIEELDGLADLAMEDPQFREIQQRVE